MAVMVTADPVVKAQRSGWCNRDIPLGHVQHRRCEREYLTPSTGTLCVCNCECHAQPIGAPAPDVPTPGLVHGMTDAAYHADPIPGGSLSSTFVRLLTEHVPAKAVELRKRPPTAAMNLGKAAHRHALGAGPELIVWQHDGRTKAGKDERAERANDIASERVVAVSQDDKERINAMVTALRSEPEVVAILDASDTEVSGFWQEGPIWCRARYDLLADSGAHDYKTSLDITVHGFSKSLANFGYHQQADFYQRGLRALDHPAAGRPLQFICQDSKPPYLVQIHQPDEEAMDFARVLNDQAIATYAECVASGTWPGFPQLVNDPTPLPAWYFFEHEDDVDLKGVAS